MSKFLDQIKQAELDRVAFDEAEARIASDRAGKAAAEEERARQRKAEREARARAEVEARALEAAQSRLEAEREAWSAAQARLDAAAEAGRIARERMVTELELRRATQARTEREADAALASLENDAPTGALPLSDEPMSEGEPPRRANSRRDWLVLAAALLVALAAVLAAGISIGRIGAAGAQIERK